MFKTKTALMRKCDFQKEIDFQLDFLGDMV